MTTADEANQLAAASRDLAAALTVQEKLVDVTAFEVIARNNGQTLARMNVAKGESGFTEILGVANGRLDEKISEANTDIGAVTISMAES